jgi:hypothetical protein
LFGPVHFSVFISIYIYVDVVEWSRALDVRLSEWCCSVSMVWVQIPSREEQKFYFKFGLYDSVLFSNSSPQNQNFNLLVWIKFLNLVYMYMYIYIQMYVWKLNQTVLELDFLAVKFLFFPRRDLPNTKAGHTEVQFSTCFTVDIWLWSISTNGQCKI